MIDKDTEIARLRAALKESKKEVKSLKGKLNTAKTKNVKMGKELKSLKKKQPSAPLATDEMLEEFLNMLDGISFRRL